MYEANEDDQYQFEYPQLQQYNPYEDDYQETNVDDHYDHYEEEDGVTNQIEEEDEVANQIDYGELLKNYRKLLEGNALKEYQKKYLRDIHEKTKVRYYKEEFKFDKRIHEIYPLQTSINARQLFQKLQSEFKKIGYELCEITIKTYRKDLEDRQKKYEAKLTRLEREIQNILKKECYGQYAQKSCQKSYKAVTVQFKSPQFIHFILKIPRNISPNQLSKLKTNNFMPYILNKYVLLKVEEAKFKTKDYLNVSNSSYCNTLQSWDIGCRVKSSTKLSFYSYFEPKGQHYITFSRSMQNEEEAIIREICIYNSFESNVVLRTVIKKQQIYQLIYSQNKKDIYIFLSSPPVYQFSVIPPNTYCLPNFLGNWERVQNFLLLKHRSFKNNDFLRLFLYSNSYMHLKLDNNDPESCKNINIDIELLQMELKQCKKSFIQKDIQYSKQIPQALSLFDNKFVDQALSFIKVPGQPFLTQHLKWKLSYQIMLLMRFNVIGPNDLKDFLRLVQINQDRLLQILQCLSRRSAGYTNKVAGLNRFKSKVYQKLKKKIFEFLVDNQKRGQEEKERRSRFEYSCLIYKVSLTPSGILPNPISHETKCRLIRQYQNQTQFFLKVTLLDDSGETMKNQRYMYNKIMRRLLDKITLSGKVYVPLGWSGSQLRGSCLWYVSQIAKDEGNLKRMTQASILQFLGDFSKIPIAAKKAARIGQAFSSSYYYNSQNVKEIIIDDEVSKKNYLYTDGIGMISHDLFEKISKQFKDQNIAIHCCLQIRYKGAKGVVLLNELLEDNTIVLRKSMIKYECNDPAAKKYLDILSWDKYLAGYLNRQIIILLKSLNISDEAFLQFQRKYVKYLNQLDFRNLDGNLLRIFNDADQDSEDSFALTITALKDFDLSKDLFFQQFLQSVKDNKFLELKRKSRILIDKSARLIGVIDDYDVLEEGQLFCAIQKPLSQVQVIKGYVIITRNPSLSPADVRKCRCLSLEEIDKRMKTKGLNDNYFKRFINCIVFPMKGLIPLTAQISGSDLDGDIFFICWDQKFIIKEPQPPQTIDNPDKKPSPVYFGQAEYRHMLDFFINFANNQKLGRINNTHLVIADRSPIFANDKDCRKLAEIHGKAVDYAKSGQPPEDVPYELRLREYPDFMDKWSKPSYDSQSILGLLYRECKQEIQHRNDINRRNKQKLQFEAELIKHLPLTIEKHLIRRVMEQLISYQQDITDLLRHANVQSQFELYAGSSADSDELRNEFGRKRLVDMLQSIRYAHQQKFFGAKTPEYERYKRLKSNKLKKNGLFAAPIIQKAIMAYVISYYCYSLNQNKRVLESVPGSMKQLCSEIEVYRKERRYEGKYLGFIWFIVPKIIINIKSSNKEKVTE